MDMVYGCGVRKEIKMFPSAREIYRPTFDKMFGELDEYFSNNPPSKQVNGFDIVLTNELSKILIGCSLDEIKNYNESTIDFKNLMLGNMYFYVNQEEDPEYRYEVKYLIHLENEKYKITLLVRATKFY